MVAQYLFNKYSDMLFKNVSWDVNLKYMSEAEQNLATTLATTMSKNNVNVSTELLKTPSKNSFYDTINDLHDKYIGTHSNSPSNAQPYMQSNWMGLNIPNMALLNQSNGQARTQTHQTNATKFNWQERAGQICESIQKQGMDPTEFACLSPDAVVSDNFSWRGYAKMICSRLATSYDTGLPETCGCPSSSWSGWKA